MGVFTALDTEGPVKDWLRTQGTPAGERVYLSHPRGCPTDGSGNALDYIVMARVAGAPEGGHLRIDAPLMTFSCWGPTKARASSLAHALATLFESTPVGTAMGTIVFLGSAVELGPINLADPDQPAVGMPSRARYVLDVSMRVRPST